MRLDTCGASVDGTRASTITSGAENACEAQGCLFAADYSQGCVRIGIHVSTPIGIHMSTPYSRGAQNAPQCVHRSDQGSMVINAVGPIRSDSSEPALAAPTNANHANDDTQKDAAEMTVTATPMPRTARAPRGNLIAAAEGLLIASREMEEHSTRLRVRAVAGARDAGMTWDDIAGLLGMSAPATRSAYERAARR